MELHTDRQVLCNLGLIFGFPLQYTLLGMSGCFEQHCKLLYVFTSLAVFWQAWKVAQNTNGKLKYSAIVHTS